LESLHHAGAGLLPRHTVANPSTATQAGNQAAVARGLNGNAAENAGTGYLTNVLNGKYLGGQNLDPVHRSIAASVIPGVNAQFSLGGRYGSPDHAGSMTTALANAEAPYDYGNYQTERANQQSAAGMAPSYASQDWQDIAGLQGAGSQQDQIAQNQVDANKQRWDYNQNLGQNKLQQYMQLLMGRTGATRPAARRRRRTAAAGSRACSAGCWAACFISDRRLTHGGFLRLAHRRRLPGMPGLI
jgi:hypothetical protein